MLDNISKYKYIRDTILYAEDNQPRATIDNQVLGIREQVCLPKLVDFFYLNELKAIHGTALENTVDKPEWPVPYDEFIQYKLPEPELGNYFDVDGLVNIEFNDDIFENTGGDYIDYDQLYQELNEEDDSYTQDKQKYFTDFQEEDSEEREDHADNILDFNNREDAINERYKNTSKEYKDALDKAEEGLVEDNKQWNKLVENLWNEFNRGEISKGEFNTRRQELENDFFEFRLKHYAAIQKAMLTFNDTNMEQLDELQNLEKERNEELKQFNENIDTIRKRYDNKVKEREELHKETVNGIYLSSNGAVGTPWNKNMQKLLQDLEELELYNARNNVSKAIPWVPLNRREWFIEYNDRLYADWEKCIWRKETPNISKVQDGYMEQLQVRQTVDAIDTEYGTLSGYTVSNNFSRWHGGDAVMMSRNYRPDPKASESSQYSFTYDYKVRVGNRHDQGNITAVKILGVITGYGEGSGGSENSGYHYGIVEAHKDSIAQEDYLAQIDDEDDTNVANLQDLEEEYNNAKYVLDNELLKAQDELKYKLSEDLLELEHQFNNQIRTITGSKIQGITSIQLAANTLKFNGEDNTELLNQIRDALDELNENIATAKEKYEKDVDDLKTAYNEDKQKLNDDYYEELENLNQENREKIDEENQRHDDKLKEIRDDYDSAYENWEQDATNERDGKIAEAREELDEFNESYQEAKNNWDEEKVQQWNDRYEDEYPDAKLDEGYSIIDNGVPLGALSTFEERREAWNSFVKAADDWSISWYNPRNAAIDKYNTAVANANKDFIVKLDEFERLDSNQREVWKFSIEEFAEFAELFTDEQQTEFPGAWGEKGAFGFTAIKVWIKTDYKANTGVDYPDYKKLDEDEETTD